MPPSDDLRDSSALRQEGPQQDGLKQLLYAKLAKLQAWRDDHREHERFRAACDIAVEDLKEIIHFFAALSASRTAPAPQQEDEIAVGQIWSAPDGRQLRVAGLAESQARIAMRNVESNRLTYMDRSNFDASQKWHLTRVSPSPELSAVRTDQTELRAAQARIRVLETSVDYLRYLVDHPVTQVIADPQHDPVAILEGLLAIPGVREAASRSAFGSIVYAADKVIQASAQDPPVAPAEGEQ